MVSFRFQNSRRRAIRGLLHVSGDGLRVVDDDTKGLIVDQTIEKVSFCAPDRNHERGFSYICRDGTTRRWMCHGFLASKDSGERLSHAVGCAFTVCLERKQRRDTECSVTMTFDMQTSTFTRNGSFRQPTMTERFHNKVEMPSAIVPPQQKPHNPFAIERPHATPMMLERQGSFRGFSGLNSQSPFKRQMSLRLSDLPSNSERQKSFLEPLTNGHVRTVSPIPEVVAQPQPIDNVSALCKELSQGLSLLTRNDAAVAAAGDELNFSIQATPKTTAASDYVLPSTISDSSPKVGAFLTSTPSVTAVVAATSSTGDYISMHPAGQPLSTVAPLPVSVVAPTLSSRVSPLPVAQISPNRHRASVSGEFPATAALHLSSVAAATTTDTSSLTSPTAVVAPNNSLPRADQWLGQVVMSASPSSRRAPALNSHSRTKSLTTDPFDAEWVSSVTKADDLKSEHRSTNPFISPPKPPAESFQVQL